MKRLLVGFGAALGVLAYLLGIRRSVALDGLRRAFPDKTERERRRIARAAYAQLGRGLLELIGRPPEVRFPDWEVLVRAKAQGKGVLCTFGHYGNFELLARAMNWQGERVTIVGRRLRGRFNRWLVQSRGISTLPDRASSADAIAALRRGEILGIAVDQNMRPSRGIFVDFFGTPACTTPAAAVYALRAGAPVITVIPVRQPDGTHVVQMRGPYTTSKKGHAAVVDITQQLTAAIEQAVREHPDHWYWVHRRWKTRPGD